jgi:hydrophobe/amphiphile efflux-1 (HAE1) family protein
MRFTDRFIERPVLAIAINLFILLLGLRALATLPLQQYPTLESSVITVTTAYPGAGAELVQGFITTPLQQAIADAEGIDYLTSESALGVSTITANIKLNYDPSAALASIMAKVAQVRGELPRDALDPVIEESTGSTIALMYLSFFSKDLSLEQVTDYVTRAVQPRLQSISGVAQAQLFGGQTFAMRVWLDPRRMAGANVTAQEVVAALLANNYQAAAGQTKGDYVAININAHTGLDSIAGFQDIVVASHEGRLVRLRDVAQVTLSSATDDSLVTFDGQQAVFVGISPTPAANPLTTIAAVRAELPALERQLPPGVEVAVVYDATVYIKAAIEEVLRTLLEAILIVVLVVFLFLGSVRAMLIPVVTIPLSLVGAAFLMLALGFSLNLLTLLAMVLAIGLVVDDAIIVVENSVRHIRQEGATPVQAALRGAREIAAPIVAMSLTLAMVYAPMGFLGGLTGALFKEFAFALAGAVLVSGFVALTLSPLMCAHWLRADQKPGRLARVSARLLEGLKARYQRKLHRTLDYPSVTLTMVVLLLGASAYLYLNTQKELAPVEDQGALFAFAKAPHYANLDYLIAFTDELNPIYRAIPETASFYVINGMGSPNLAISGLSLKPWDQRRRSQTQVQTELQTQVNGVAGLQTAVIPMPSLPGSGGMPVQFVIATTQDYRLLDQISQQVLDVARQSGLFLYVESDLQFDNPQLELWIDRDLAGTLGITPEAIGSALGSMLGGGYINRFGRDGRSYEVIPQVSRQSRADLADLLRASYVRSAGGQLIALDNLVNLSSSVQPGSLKQFQQLNAATVQGVAFPGVSLGQALRFLRQHAERLLPDGFVIGYGGESRQYVQEGSTLIYTFAAALLVIYLALAVQFGSFRDPLIILITVPLSTFGALIPLSIGVSSINIYTQIGLLTLIGLISKHGILMVAFANELQRDEGLDRRQAIERAAAIRLRPILMTTSAMVVGVLPLVFASGAGAASRLAIGAVIAAGMSIGTLFTLFVLPVMYNLLATPRGTAVSAPST